MPVHSFTHLNNNKLCAIDIETTGVEIGYHEIIQICFIPLDANLEFDKTRPFIDLLLKPLHPERTDYAAAAKISKAKLAKAVREGMDPLKAFDVWEHWFTRLKLPEDRRIVPLGYNIDFDRGHLREWMGFHNYAYYIDSRIRDPFLLANMLNDRSDLHGEQLPFPDLKLGQLANYLKIETEPDLLHDAIYDAMLATKCYKKMLQELIVEAIL